MEDNQNVVEYEETMGQLMDLKQVLQSEHNSENIGEHSKIIKHNLQSANNKKKFKMMNPTFIPQLSNYYCFPRTSERGNPSSNPLTQRIFNLITGKIQSSCIFNYLYFTCVNGLSVVKKEGSISSFNFFLDVKNGFQQIIKEIKKIAQFIYVETQNTSPIIVLQRYGRTADILLFNPLNNTLMDGFEIMIHEQKQQNGENG